VRARSRGWLVIAATGLLVGCTPPQTGPSNAQPSATTIAASGLPNGSIRISGLKQPLGVATEKGVVWVTEYEAGNLVRIDPGASRITASIHVALHASHLVIHGGFAWVIDDQASALISVDTRSNQVRSFPLRPRPQDRPVAVAAGEGSVWVVLANTYEYALDRRNNLPTSLVRIDPASGEVLDTISLPGAAAGVAVGGGSVWVASRLDPPVVYRIDPKTKRVAATIDAGHPASGAIIYEEPYLWAASQDGYLTRIDSRTNRATAFEVGSPEWPALVSDGQSIWISAPLDNLVARFDPAAGAISRTVHTGGSHPQGFALLGNDIWVANYGDGTVTKLPIN
jgi:streptogramin lyase